MSETPPKPISFWVCIITRSSPRRTQNHVREIYFGDFHNFKNWEWWKRRVPNNPLDPFYHFLVSYCMNRLTHGIDRWIDGFICYLWQDCYCLFVARILLLVSYGTNRTCTEPLVELNRTTDVITQNSCSWSGHAISIPCVLKICSHGSQGCFGAQLFILSISKVSNSPRIQFRRNQCWTFWINAGNFVDPQPRKMVYGALTYLLVPKIK